MADTPTDRYRLRSQSLGSNTNLWGDTYLNDSLKTLDRGSKGYQAIALTGDATLTWTSYATANQGQVATIKFTGTLSAAASVVVPGYEWTWDVWNAAGADVTVKTAAGTGVAIPNGHRVRLYCDAVDVYNVSPTLLPANDLKVGGKITNVTAGVAATDAVNKTQLDAAIAAASSASVVGTVKVDSLANAAFLGAALTAGQGISISDDGDSLGLSTPAHNGVLTSTITSGTVAMTAGGRYRITGGQADLPTLLSAQFVIVELDPAAGTTVTVGRNAQTIDGAAEDDTYIGDGGASPVIRYSYSSAGAVKSEIIGSVP